jgi:hypothetical protein
MIVKLVESVPPLARLALELDAARHGPRPLRTVSSAAMRSGLVGEP